MILTQNQAAANLIAEKKALVEQLRREMEVNREKVSVVVHELIAYCESHKHHDVLINGFRSEYNPFNEDNDSTCF